MQFLAGHLQMGFYVLFGFVTYVVGRCVAPSPFPRVLVSTFLRFVVVPLGIAFSVGAIQLLPSLELISFNPRTVGKSYSDVVASALPLRQLITLIVPNFFGSPREGGSYWGHFNFIELCGYPGVVTLLLAITSLLLLRPSRQSDVPARYPNHSSIHTYFIALALFSLAVALGTPLYHLLYLLPGFRQVAAVARILVLFNFSLAILAAFGMQTLLDRTMYAAELSKSTSSALPSVSAKEGAPSSQDGLVGALFRSDPVIAAGLLLLIGIAICLRLAPSWLESWSQTAFPNLDSRQREAVVSFKMLETLRGCALPTALVILTCGILVTRHLTLVTRHLPLVTRHSSLAVLLTADLFLFGLHFNPSVPANLLPYETEGIQELKSLTKDGQWRIVSYAPSSANRFVDCLPPNLNMLFGIPSAQGSDSLFTRWYAEAFRKTGGDVLQRNPEEIDRRALGRLSVRYLIRPTSGSGIEIERNPSAMPRGYQLGRNRVVPVLVHDFGPNRLSLNPALDSSVMLTDAFYPGWRGFWDGTGTAIMPSETMGRMTTKGGSRTTLLYAPATVRCGMFVSLVALALLVGTWKRART